MAESKSRWIDLIDPDEAALREAWPHELHPNALASLLGKPEEGNEPRPKLVTHGSYAFGVLLLPVAVVDEDRVYYQEVGLVLNVDLILTVRKTPANGDPLDLSSVRESSRANSSSGMVAHMVVDEVAEGFLNLIDSVQDEIDELEDHVEQWSQERVRRRLSELRHDLLQIRRMLGPTRDAARRVLDDRVELETGDLFPRETELHFGEAYDKLLRAGEGLELARDLISGVRDYHQSKVAHEQNEVMKRLTVVASLLLVPTFIVGVYGQNFEHMPELHWMTGYAFSWAIILITTVGQLFYFRWKKWI